MNKLSMIALVFTLVGCGQSEKIIETRLVSDQSQVESLEGYYDLPNGGYIEIVELDNGSYVLYGTQRVVSVNSDAGLALLPQLPTGQHFLKNGAMTGLTTLSYNITTNDLEVDGSNVDVSSSRSTFYEISKNSSGKLEIHFIIYSATGLVIEVNRTVTSL